LLAVRQSSLSRKLDLEYHLADPLYCSSVPPSEPPHLQFPADVPNVLYTVTNVVSWQEYRRWGFQPFSTRLPLLGTHSSTTVFAARQLQGNSNFPFRFSNFSGKNDFLTTTINNYQ
jgi:hypothetical protein